MDGVVALSSEFVRTKAEHRTYPNMHAAVIETRVSEEDILRKHDRLIRHLAVRYSRFGLHIDDLLQEGRLALMKAARNWDPSYGASVWTYADDFVDCAMRRLVRRELRAPTGSDAESIDAQFDIRSDGANPEEFLDRAEQEAQEDEWLSVMRRERALVSNKDENLLRMYFDEGKSFSEIAAELRISKSTAHDRMTALLSKLRERMEARA